MLEVTNLAVSYGRHRALEGVSLSVRKGEICVILGANGAGKSTLLKTVAGMVRGEPGGEIAMNGRAITRMKPHRIVEEGIALVPEGRGIFGELTVAENLQLGAFAIRARSREAATLAEIYRLFPRLAERKGQIARTMSGGEQQMVAIGRALMSRPEILMLDEPSLGLSPLLSRELFRALAEVAGTGVGILLVEQNARQSLRIAGRGYLIENGSVTGENTAQALMNDPAVVNAYLGGGAVAKVEAPVEGPRFVLPPQQRLPLDAAGVARAAGALAARAGGIRQAFQGVLRREGQMPSAFVGRYDPKAAGDPWAAFAALPLPAPEQRPPVAAADAQRIGATAASLADRAAARLAAHVTGLRLSSPRPAAFAGERAAAEALPHGGLGHNSAGLVAEEAAIPVEAPAPALPALSIRDLAARAAAIHAAHVARRRAALPPFAATPRTPLPTAEAEAEAEAAAEAPRPGLSAHTIAVAPNPGGGPQDTARKKRKKHKEI